MFEGKLEAEADWIIKRIEIVKSKTDANRVQDARYVLVEIKTKATEMAKSLTQYLNGSGVPANARTGISGDIELLFRRLETIVDQCRRADEFLFSNGTPQKFDWSDFSPRRIFNERMLPELTRTVLDVKVFVKSIKKELVRSVRREF